MPHPELQRKSNSDLPEGEVISETSRQSQRGIILIKVFVKQPDVIIIGGGLAGLTAAIHLTLGDLKVKLFEKESYPHHKVCGEYLSNEILPYLLSLGVDLQLSGPVEINTLKFSDHKGREIFAPLSMGGIGISRFELDNFLYKYAISLGVEVCRENITSIEFKEEKFFVKTSSGIVISPFVLGAYGKRSLIDKKLDRDFITRKSGWVAVKGHYKNEEYPQNTVSLHNFKGGYCGLSKTETGAVNVCYLATYRSFKDYKDPQRFKKEILLKNPQLNQFFKNSSPLFSRDITIAQISFDKKKQVHGHVLMIGDAAGLIHPLCGNGMAMAIHSAKLASESILENFNEGNFDRRNIEKRYIKYWRKNFRSRLRMGRFLQRILLNSWMAGISQMIIYNFPSILPAIISKTHGKKVI